MNVCLCAVDSARPCDYCMNQGESEPAGLRHRGTSHGRYVGKPLPGYVSDTNRSWLDRALASDASVVPKPRIRLKTDIDGFVHCVLLMGTGKRTMWFGAELDAMRAAFRGEFTRTA